MHDTSVQEDSARLFTVRHRILQIDRDLEALQRQRHVLSAENDKLRFNVAAKQVKNAPMRTLIPEICALIFSLYLESGCNNGCAAGFDLCPVQECDALILAHVCRRWRVMVLNNPCLWTSLHIRLTNPRMDVANQINFWFRQARHVPMAVTVCPGLPMGSKWNSEQFKMVNITAMRHLRPFLDRIRSLDLHVHQAALTALFPSRSITSMMELTEMYLEHCGYILDERQIGHVHSPKLRRLRFSDPSPLTRMLDNSALETIHIDKSEFWEYPRKVSTLLSSSPALQDLSIVFPRNLISCNSDSVTLPLVSRLKLEWYYACSPVPLFRSIEAPQLQHLCVSHSNFLTTFSRETMHTLRGLIESSSSLTTLDFSGCNLFSMCENSVAICEHARQLQELSITGCYGISALLTTLSPGRSGIAWPCPELRHLKLCGLRDHDLRFVIDFVRSRMAPKTGEVEGREYLRELTLDARIQDFTPQARIILLRGLHLIRDYVKITGPLEGALVQPFNEL